MPTLSRPLLTRLWRLTFAALVLSGFAEAQPAFTLLPDVAEPSQSSIFPNGTWATTPYENEAVLNDDWTFGGASGIPVHLYWAFSPGTEFGAASATIGWDPAAVGFDAVTEAGGAFEGPEGSLFTSMLGAPDALRIDAARLDGANQIAAPGEHVARLDFRVLRPGFSAIPFTAASLRTYDGSGGQTDVTVATESAAVRAYLGDVATTVSGGPGDPTSADGIVDFEDVVVFTQGYYAGTSAAGGSLAAYKSKLDIGPTLDGTPLSRPQSDLQVEFEDLIIFALSYAYSQTGFYPVARGEVSPVHLHVGPARLDGDGVLVPLSVSGAVDLRAMAVELDVASGATWDRARGADGGFATGEGREALLISTGNGPVARLDAAVLSGPTLDGDRTLAVVRLLPASGGTAAGLIGRTDLLQVARARARTSSNTPVPVSFDPVSTDTEGAAEPLGLTLTLGPNPARTALTFGVQLPASGAVRVRVYDARGRLVATPVTGDLRAGQHAVAWTHGLPSGRYLAVLQSGDARRTSSFTISR